MIDRRMFLARTGILGAALAVPGLLDAAVSPARADVDLVGWLRTELQNLARETIQGLVAFVVPGSDEFSRAQGTVRTDPGGVDLRTADWTMNLLDRYIPFPDRIGLPTITAAARQLGSIPQPLPPELAAVAPRDVLRLDRALQFLVENDETIPVSIGLALLLDVVATLVAPAAILRIGRFDSMFARLTVAEKARVFANLERENTLVTRFAPTGVVADVDGLLKFAAAAVLALPGMGAYSEWPSFDRGSRRPSSRPVGWDLARYLPGRATAVEGHAEFQGYYQGRRSVDA